MPTYEFKCETCGELQTIHASIREIVKPLCTTCDKPLKKIYASPSITFKGSGFYSTDGKK